MPDLSTTAAPVRDLAAKFAPDSDERRRPDPQVIAEIVSAGFARHFVPTAFGGRAGGHRELVDALVHVAGGDAAAAWVAGLTATVARMAAYLPDAGQAQLWADGPDRLIVGGLMPVGIAVPDGAGLRLSGRWAYMSGVDFSEWALLCATVHRPGGSTEVRYLAVPRANYWIEETWFTVGMRGTGSNTLVVDDAFVPAELSFDRDVIAAGPAPAAKAPCHRVPLRAVNGLTFAAPALGAGRALLQGWTEYMAAKPRRPGLPAAHRQTSSVAALGRSSGELDLAELLLQRVADLADTGDIPPLAAARCSRDCALAVELTGTAVNRLFRAAGTQGQTEGTALERIWRDVNAATTHIAVQFDAAADRYAAEVFGPE